MAPYCSASWLELLMEQQWQDLGLRRVCVTGLSAVAQLACCALHSVSIAASHVCNLMQFFWAERAG